MKKFHLTTDYALINFDASRIDSMTGILSSNSFKKVFKQFIKTLKSEKHPILEQFHGVKANDVIDAYKLLMVYSFEQLIEVSPRLARLVKVRTTLFEFTNLFYDYWRKLERFAAMQSPSLYSQSAKVPDLIAYADTFNAKVLGIYRTITQAILGRPYQVYRQLPAGVNASFLYTPHTYKMGSDYDVIQHIPFVTTLLSRPPFIAYTKANTRKGLFKEIYNNPLKDLTINKLHYFVFPIKVGRLLAFTYIHRDFIHHGVGLSNLFDFASIEEYRDAKPDLIYIYGIREDEYDCTYYHDKDEDVYVGFVSRADKNDYFGYLKKMLLTLHNIAHIDRGNLPIHGAMVSIVLKNNKKKNVVIIGDSGAGKSETLEALRAIGSDYIKQMRIIFDDMGVFTFENDQVVALGTELGAFVRLDDLDAGYAYKEIDRAIFLNPDQVNARVILPVSSYEYISRTHRIDMVLYANNYSDDEQDIKLFTNVKDALAIFTKGERLAKGTTSEVGLVASYFANPFGPVQRKAQVDILLEKYFSRLKAQNVLLGEIYTRLAISSLASKGPEKASEKLLQYIKEN